MIGRISSIASRGFEAQGSSILWMNGVDLVGRAW